MTWMKVDDGFWSHPKTLALPPEAVALWVRAGSWAAQQLTDGAVRRHVLRLFGATDADAQELVDAGLWEVDADGWRFHDWLDYQPSREEVQAQRSTAKERMRTLRARRKSVAPDDVRANEPRTDRERALTVPNPDPTRPERERSAPPAPAARSHSLPSPFSPSPDTREWAAGQRPDVDLDVVCAKLVATHAASGKTSADWQGVLRTWVLNERVAAPMAAGGASVVNLDAYRPTAPSRPAPVAWCGSCEEYDRRYEDEAGRWHKCERCHPAMQGEPPF